MGSHRVGHDWSNAAAEKQSKGWFSSLEAEFSGEQCPLGEASREGPGKEDFLTLIAQLLSLSRADLRLRGFIRQKESVSLLLIIQASLITQLVKNPPSMQETWVRDPWLGRSLVGKIPWRRERLPIPVFWPGEFHGIHGVAKSWTQLSNFHFTSLLLRSNSSLLSI